MDKNYKNYQFSQSASQTSFHIPNLENQKNLVWSKIRLVRYD